MRNKLNEVSADTYFQSILNFCKDDLHLMTMENVKARMLSIKFDMEWMALDVAVKVDAKRKSVIFNTVLPVICRIENESKMKIHLHDISNTGYGSFHLYNGRITFLYNYSFEGEDTFNKKAFESYLDAAVMVPYTNAQSIMDVAARYEPVITDPDDEWEPFPPPHAPEYPEYPDDALKNWPMADLEW